VNNASSPTTSTRESQTRDPHTFEQAFARLETILERMNSNAVSLDESLKLFEEADQLIKLCGDKLNKAESRVEMLIKNRQGELAIGPDQQPAVQNFISPSEPPPF
jgi:exodeoxyribonuclease VII small subunit